MSARANIKAESLVLTIEFRKVMQPDVSTFFRDKIQAHMAFLFERGFRLAENKVTNTPTLVEFVLLARNVAIILSLDRREKTTGLYVAKLRDGEITKRGEVGYYGDLCAYLRKYCAFRGSIAGGMSSRDLSKLSLEQRIDQDLRLYASALCTHAPRIINDLEDFG
jgi:hypothetical protein